MVMIMVLYYTRIKTEHCRLEREREGGRERERERERERWNFRMMIEVYSCAATRKHCACGLCQ